MKSINILMVCYYFPPLVDVGCKRSVAFSRYFKKYGWNPHVISVKNPDKAFCMIGKDRPPSGIPTDYTYSILNVYRFFGKINGLLSRILRLFGVEPKRNYFYEFFCIPDIFFGWIALTAINAARTVKERDIDLIYVSCSPFSAGVIGVILKFLTEKPLIVDFRDIYALDIESLKNVSSKMPLRKRVDSLIEKMIVKWADLFVVTTDEMNKAYSREYGHLSGKIFTVHNGFEPDSLPEATLSTTKFDKFTIIYAGNYYFEVPGGDLFFKALASLQVDGKINSTNFQFLYFGQSGADINKLAADFQIENLVNTKGLIPHEKVLATIQRSHMQLLRIMKPMISTKLFEGIALNIPLLAIIPSGEVEQIIKKYSPSSYVIPNASPLTISDSIVEAIERRNRKDIEDNRVDAFSEQFSRESLACKLMTIIETYIHLEK